MMGTKQSFILSGENTLIVVLMLILTSTALYSTNHVIIFGGTVGLNYSPNELTVAVGDTITWQGSFSTHPLSSTSVPQGGEGFQKSSGTSFSYTVQAPGTYNYKCDVHALSGMTGSFSALVSSVDKQGLYGLPNVYRLNQNYPNPFNPVTTISYQLQKASYVELNVYNLLGQSIATLVSERQPAGFHQLKWEADQNPSGVYYYQLKADEFQDVKRMFLLR